MGGDRSVSTTHSSLLLRIRNPKDGDAWQTFAEVYTPLVYGYCRRCGLQEADAADVTQEVLACVARSIKHFDYDPARGRFRDWLGTTARNELSRFVKRRQRLNCRLPFADELLRLESADSDPVWVDHFHSHVLDVALERVRLEFEPATWRAFERVWLDRMGAAKAAADLGIPIDKVYVAKSRVLKRLREEVVLLAEDIPLANLRDTSR
jgi:RNA polymerase sigma-70 factor (ECF subfamily)